VVTVSTTSVVSFIGRQYELAILSAASRVAAHGRRQLVLVSGETGIGKTTLQKSSLTLETAPLLQGCQ
jgi:Flp pilus assembly CpaF family ATPase